MKYLFLLFSLNAFAWNPTEIKTLNCEYGAGQDIGFATSQKKFTFNRVYNNKQVKIFVQDTNKPNEVNDYMVVSDFKGHKMTYSLKCKKM